MASENPSQLICPCCLTLDELIEKLKKCNQEHLLDFYTDLSPEELKTFNKQLYNIDFEEANQLFQKATKTLEEQSKPSQKKIQPVSISEFGSALTCGQKMIEHYWNEGMKMISAGKVAALVLAGGQGTRLGLNIPKGLISINLPSGKTLFQIYIERIRRLENLCNKSGVIPLYVMTSDATHKHIEDFLKGNNFFGMKENNVVLFRQGWNPCFTFDGKIILSAKGEVATAPDGTGGIYKAMDKQGVFKDMDRRGIYYVHLFPIDNILVKVADPIFVGYCAEHKADCAAKVVKKHSAKQNVGVVCKVDDCFSVVEYSEISDEHAAQKDDKGELAFQAGSICIHLFTVDFMKDMALMDAQLKPHVAKKKVAYVDKEGVARKPDSPNAIKIEMFVFEAFKFSKFFAMWEVGYDEFSPIKNPNSEKYECPLTARTDLLSLHRNYIRIGGGKISDHAEIEISPLLSYAGENLTELVDGQSFLSFTSAHLQSEEEYQKMQVDETFKPFSKITATKPTTITL